MQFIIKNSPHFISHSGYKENYIEEIMNITLFGLRIESHTNWWTFMEEMSHRRSGVCCAVRSMVHVRNINNLEAVYFAYSHSIVKYGTTLWGNSSNSGEVFA